MIRPYCEGSKDGFLNLGSVFRLCDIKRASGHGHGQRKGIRRKKMGIYEELQARALIAQVTDEAGIRELINSGKAVFYIGFDPTADSLHVGHFMALCLM